jgi:hypothetical protein
MAKSMNKLTIGLIVGVVGLVLIGAVVLVLLLNKKDSGNSPTGGNSEIVTVDSGQTVEIKVGDVIRHELWGSGGTPLQWEFEVNSDALSFQKKETETVPQMDGGRYSEYFYFRAEKSGQATVKFYEKYLTSDEIDETSIEIIDVVIVE